ncbi:hypothetical protein MTR67_035317 [Solanum verrucosum]|uniref:Reverse transcriptase/retrotransposon-derived protein RNase H-like domain-containing protein n=1 Tax=Solanum verrucosum TaxID=315347 RepID=A0AAF0U9Q8_SOLVR|nr:hypothetical protein MTR67_035317 [Solanum verrucosum]
MLLSVTMLSLSDGIQVHPKKIKTIKNLPRPLFASNIQSLLGLTGYYIRFVEGFSSIVSPLTALTHKKVKFLWSKACGKSFQELKDRLTSTPILTLPKGSNDFVVYCDASRISLSCILMQHGKVIAYASRQLKDYDMSVIYPSGKANVVVDTLSRLSMNSFAHIEDGKKELVCDVHRLAQLGVRLVDSNKDDVIA